MNVGILLRYYRKLKNLSQTELAESAEINEKYYSRLERDENNPTYHVLEKIVNALNMKMMQLAIATEEYCGFDYIFFPTDVKVGTFIKEVPPRFVAEVNCNNKILQVYIASSVKLSSLIPLENSRVNLQRIVGKSKYEYSLFALDYNNVKIILDLNVVNKMFYELYCTGTLEGYNWYGEGISEIVCNHYKTDYYFEQEKILVENKTIISGEAFCKYPVESAVRFEQQLSKLEDLLNEGYMVRLNFFILTPWTNKIKFKDEIFHAITKLQQKGMKVFLYYMYYEKEILKTVRMRIVKNKEEDYHDILFYYE